MTRDLVDDMGGGRGRPPQEFEERAASARHVEMAVTLHYDTGKAVLVSNSGEEARAVFLPKSQIEIHNDGVTGPATRKNGQTVTLPIVCIVVPEWLAKEKGLI